MKEVHLTNPNSLRKNPNAHAFRLNEDGPQGSGPQSIIDTINWLDVEKQPRYKPQKGSTFCNVYATDLATQSHVFLPRVWWMPKAIQQMKQGINVKAEYGVTVYELNANSLYRWLVEWGETFLWRRLNTVEEAQQAANDGEVVVICGRRTVESSPGHISAVAPETPEVPAIRKDGKVVRPVQSQAGGACIRLEASGLWWQSKDFAEFGFWATPKPLNVGE